MSEDKWIITGQVPAGPFYLWYEVQTADERIVAERVPNPEMAALIANIPVMQAELVEIRRQHAVLLDMLAYIDERIQQSLAHRIDLPDDVLVEVFISAGKTREIAQALHGFGAKE